MNQWIAIWLKQTHSTGDFGYHRYSSVQNCRPIFFLYVSVIQKYFAHHPPPPKTVHTALRCYRGV